MKQMTIDQLEASVRQALKDAAGEDLIIMDGDEPIAVVHGIEVEGGEADAWIDDDPELWEMIERSRRQPRRRLEDVEADLRG